MGATGSPVPEAGSQAMRNGELGASLSREIGRAARESTDSTGAPVVSAIRSVMVSGPAGDTWTRSAEVPAACQVVPLKANGSIGFASPSSGTGPSSWAYKTTSNKTKNKPKTQTTTKTTTTKTTTPWRHI